jgi:hypothetical protein
MLIKTIGTCQQHQDAHDYGARNVVEMIKTRHAQFPVIGLRILQKGASPVLQSVIVTQLRVASPSGGHTVPCIT